MSWRRANRFGTRSPRTRMPSTVAGSTTRGRHAAKATDNNPVSNAITAIKEASGGSYVGKHRANTVGVKGSSGSDDDGSKGSTEN